MEWEVEVSFNFINLIKECCLYDVDLSLRLALWASMWSPRAWKRCVPSDSWVQGSTASVKSSSLTVQLKSSASILNFYPFGLSIIVLYLILPLSLFTYQVSPKILLIFASLYFWNMLSLYKFRIIISGRYNGLLFFLRLLSVFLYLTKCFSLNINLIPINIAIPPSFLLLTCSWNSLFHLIYPQSFHSIYVSWVLFILFNMRIYIL